MKQQSWKRVISQITLATTLAQASLLGVLAAPTAAIAASTPVVINEVSPDGDWIELFASSDVNFSDAATWQLVTSNGGSVNLTGTMTPGQFKSFTFASAPLALNEGAVRLVHGSEDADAIRWGNNVGANIPAPDSNNTIARNDDGSGVWVSNVTATQDASNEPIMSGVPPTPNAVKIPATSGSAVNVITTSNQSNVTVQAGYSGTATLAVALLDSTGASTGVASAGSDSMDGGSVTGINGAGLKDGSIWVRAYTSVSGKRSTWATQIALKDTSAPAQPVPVVLAGAKNGTNVVNGSNTPDVRIGIGTPSSDAMSMMATLIDSNGSGVTGTLPFDGSKGLDARGLLDGTLTLSVVVTDVAGNVSMVGTTSLTKDTVAPSAASDLRGRAANGFVVLDWDASPSTDIGSYRIYSNGSTGDIDPNSPLGEVNASTRTFTTGVQPNGSTIFQVRSVDRFGNEETTGVNITVTVTGPLEEETLNGTNHRVLNLVDPLRLWLQISDKTNGNADVTVLNNSTTNPTSANLPSGHVTVGKYFELGTNNQTIFPMEVKIYYTKTDLVATGVSEERQLEGIRFYDKASKSWKLYGKTGVNTADVKIGSLDFAGYVWAYADHLTPIVASADVTAPTKPGTFVAAAGDGLVKLSWDRVDYTAGYLIRYRQGTNDDRMKYETVAVMGGDVTTATLKGFENGVLYEFGVAGFDWVGNYGHYAVVEQTPIKSGSSADFVVPSSKATKALPNSGSVISSGTSSTSSTGTTGTETIKTTDDSTTVAQDDAAADGSAVGGTAPGQEVAADTKQAEEDKATEDAAKAESSDDKAAQSDDNTRTLVTILIIVIAAAAGFGGYYGYQWWMNRPEETIAADTTPPVEPPVEPKKNGSKPEKGGNGRW